MSLQLVAYKLHARNCIVLITTLEVRKNSVGLQQENVREEKHELITEMCEQCIN